MAVAVGAAYTFIFYASDLSSNVDRVFPLDNTAFKVADRTRTDRLVDIAKLVADAGALPFVLTVVVIASILLIVRRRPLELFALAGGFGFVVLATHIAKSEIDRPRPAAPLVDTVGSAFPSGHASYATAYVAMAVIATRVFGGIVSRTAVVLVGVLIAAAIGSTRIYLRAHFLSDVIGGYGLGLAIFAGCAAIALVVGFIRQNARAAPGSPRA
jgi:undecaprenyl-diphosphatase